VLKGHGHDVHDGRTMKWQAGDVMLVENGCVHQHFNDDDNEDCILLVFKAKPRRGMPHHRDEQSHRQRHGLRLARPGRARALGF